MVAVPVLYVDFNNGRLFLSCIVQTHRYFKNLSKILSKPLKISFGCQVMLLELHSLHLEMAVQVLVASTYSITELLLRFVLFICSNFSWFGWNWIWCPSRYCSSS